MGIFSNCIIIWRKLSLFEISFRRPIDHVDWKLYFLAASLKTETWDYKTTCQHICHCETLLFSLESKIPCYIVIKALQLPNYQSTEIIKQHSTNMSSMPFSTTFSAPLYASFCTKANPNSSPLLPSMAVLTTSVKSSLGSSKSIFLHNGFSLQSSNLPGVLLKSRSSGIYARAATEKTLYDFNAKVSVLFCFNRWGFGVVIKESLYLYLYYYCLSCNLFCVTFDFKMLGMFVTKCFGWIKRKKGKYLNWEPNFVCFGFGTGFIWEGCVREEKLSRVSLGIQFFLFEFVAFNVLMF